LGFLGLLEATCAGNDAFAIASYFWRSGEFGITKNNTKINIDIESDRIRGFTALGVEAGEIIAAVQVAMLAGLPYTALRDAIFSHPTMLEGLIPLFSALPASPRASKSGTRRE
jgi:pyruvate/2-oxoglutarate dehydrogenase complex dihydrolipoamide dehydrogenase (E3) component